MVFLEAGIRKFDKRGGPNTQPRNEIISGPANSGPNTRTRGPETARGHITSLSRSVPTGTRVRQGFRWPPLLRVAIEHGAVHAGERAYK